MKKKIKKAKIKRTNSNTKEYDPTILAKGVFKKRKLPWIFAIVTALALAAYVALLLYRFVNGGCAYCASLRQHIGHNFTKLAILAIVWAVACAIVFLISFLCKRSLTVTATKIIFRSGRRKGIHIPYSAIERVDLGACGSLKIVADPKIKFKFKNLKNAKELYNTIVIRMNAPMVVHTFSTAPQIAPQVAPQIEDPLSNSKILYFQNLYNAGAITESQFANYVEKALETK